LDGAAITAQAVALASLFDGQLQRTQELHKWSESAVFCVEVAMPGGKKEGVGGTMRGVQLFDPSSEVLAQVSLLPAMAVRLRPQSSCAAAGTHDQVRVRIGAPQIAEHTAKVELDYICGSSCGRGFRLTLVRTDSEWLVSASEMSWSS